MSEQRTLSLGFREFRSSSYERLVEIYNANYPDYRISIAERRSGDESVDRTKYLLKRVECVDLERDRIVGFGELINVPDMYHPRKFMAGIFFFFQAEDGIRDYKVTGVQTCALPI